MVCKVNTNLKPIDVHYAHRAVHLRGAQPIIDLLQQPVKQHRVQGFGNGISAKRTGMREGGGGFNAKALQKNLP